MKKILALLMILLLAAVVFVSCDNNVEAIEDENPDAELETDLCNVAFDLDGGEGYIHEQNVVKGGKLEEVKNPVMEGFYFLGWKTEDGKAFNIAKDKVDGDMILTAEWKKDFKVGDRGPGGGVIFYIADSTKESEYTDASGNKQKLQWKYLEAAPCDVSRDTEWGSDGEYGTETGIGDGWSNTGKLREAGINNFPAARACITYSNNGFSDWFLPSGDELNELYEAKKNNSAVEAIAPDGGSLWHSGYYWTSSEHEGNKSWFQDFGSGERDFTCRDDQKNVRPVRAF